MGGSLLGLWLAAAAVALPPSDDIPEEILRIQPSLRSRSAFDNSPLSPTEQAEITDGLREQSGSVDVSPELQRLIFLLRIRQILSRFFPPQTEPEAEPLPDITF